MSRNYYEVEFTHFIVDSSEGTIFGSARVNGSGRIVNFLINDGEVKQQNGEQWYFLEPEYAEIIKDRAHAAYGQVPTYRTKRLLL